MPVQGLAVPPPFQVTHRRVFPGIHHELAAETVDVRGKQGAHGIEHVDELGNIPRSGLHGDKDRSMSLSLHKPLQLLQPARLFRIVSNCWLFPGGELPARRARGSGEIASRGRRYFVHSAGGDGTTAGNSERHRPYTGSGGNKPVPGIGPGGDAPPRPRKTPVRETLQAQVGECHAQRGEGESPGTCARMGTTPCRQWTPMSGVLHEVFYRSAGSAAVPRQVVQGGWCERGEDGADSGQGGGLGGEGVEQGAEELFVPAGPCAGPVPGVGHFPVVDDQVGAEGKGLQVVEVCSRGPTMA